MVQAVPLVDSATLAHLPFGDVRLGVSASLAMVILLITGAKLAIAG